MQEYSEVGDESIWERGRGEEFVDCVWRLWCYGEGRIGLRAMFRELVFRT
jgi:hypothetical protein